MVKVSVSKSNNFIYKVKIEGHSKYSDYGSDIVCASISSISITTVNAIVRIDKDIITYEEKDGFLSITIKKDDRIINILMENMIDLLKELAEDYPKNIKTR